MHDLLMQKSSGTFYLAVWDESVGLVSWTHHPPILGETDAPATVDDRQTNGTTAVRTLSHVSSVSLTLSDHPLILAIATIGPEGSRAAEIVQTEERREDLAPLIVILGSKSPAEIAAGIAPAIVGDERDAGLLPDAHLISYGT